MGCAKTAASTWGDLGENREVSLSSSVEVSTGNHHSADISRRAAACGRAELLANFFGGAVWGVFRENANCGDPPG